MTDQTMQEPLFDIEAQVEALCDPSHPKDAVWIAGATVIPQWLVKCDGLIVMKWPDGILITTNKDKAECLAADPSDDTRAEVLGYVEPKSKLLDRGPIVVVRALNKRGAVVIEMASSVPGMKAAMDIAKEHGEVEIVSLAACGLRRLALLRLEN